MTNRATFLKLLREDILKLDLADLDFGIYRVLNYRRDEIERFLNQRLPELMGAAFSGAATDRLADVRRTIEELRKKLNDSVQGMGLSSAFQEGRLLNLLKETPNGQRYEELLEEARLLEARAGFSQSEEDDLYNRLYIFFARYYRDGDFMMQPRRGRKAFYSVAYNGDDVHFHWKSRGSHYVKTTEELRSYVCTISDWRVSFELHAATEEKDNVKGAARFFVPLPKKVVVDSEARTLRLPFEFRPLTKVEATKYDGKAKRTSSENGSEHGDTGTNQERVLADRLDELRPKLPADLPAAGLAHQMRRYARKNRADYFVHHGLADFLTEEFAYYLKNEVLDLGALTTPEALSTAHLKLKALQQVGAEIITLLDQIESFQAYLFEKRKFVLRADYLLPIRLVPRELWPTVLANEGQRSAWRTLFGLEGELDEQTLERRPTLVVDTRHFDAAFTRQALAAFEDIDASTDGLLINAENYAALTSIAPTYAGRVKVIYIDPPYNTGNDGFIYKDDFSRHSTWLSMMEERLRIARDLLAEDGSIFVSIDDNEQTNLKLLMDRVFGPQNFVATVIWQKVFAPKNTAQHFSDDHEYMMVYAKDKSIWRPGLLERSADASARYTNPDNDDRGVWSSSDLTARNYYGDGQYEVVSPSGARFRPPSGRYWVVSRENFERLDRENRIWWGPTGSNMPRRKRFITDVKEGVVPQTLWLYKDVGHTQDAKKELLSIVTFERSEDVLNTVKPIDLIRRVLQTGTDPDEPTWVLDFFVGSGTTVQATLVQNMADGGRRKFIAVEMGQYFDQITFQRVIRAMYAPEWKDGKPKQNPLLPDLLPGEPLPAWVERGPRLVKLLRLESYEDSLNALELPQVRTARMQGQLALFDTTYLIKYMLPAETDESPVLVNTERFEDPFAYQLDIHTPAGVLETPVDIIETFNLMMGLHVRRITTLDDNGRHYTLVDALEEGRPVLVVWRDAIATLDPAHERDWLKAQLDLSPYVTIYTNADSALPNGRSLDSLFKQRMVEPGKGALR
jgi:adenine-specific DNA-methyltransferase